MYTINAAIFYCRGRTHSKTSSCYFKEQLYLHLGPSYCYTNLF